MRRLICYVLAMSSLNLTAQEIIVDNIQHQGIERGYRLAIPTGYDGNTSYPLVFNLHGFGSSAAEQEFYSDMNRIAEQEGFIVCYPDGINNAWNVGWEFGSEADDVDFISMLIDELGASFNIDTDRVYSCGMSNGGFMSYRLACELNDRIAAVASVTGSMAPLYFPDCDPGKAVSIMQFHGTADSTVLYNGSEDVGIPIDTLIAFWAANNGCESEADTNDIEDIVPEDNTTVKKIHYNDCNNDTEVIFYKVDGGGHTWPGAFLNIGITNQDIEASEIIWEFFRNKSLNDQTSPVEDLDVTNNTKIFPNPGREYINISDPGLINKEYVINSISGEVIDKGSIQNGQILISDLSSGMYILSILSESGSSTHKFFKI